MQPTYFNLLIVVYIHDKNSIQLIAVPFVENRHFGPPEKSFILRARPESVGGALSMTQCLLWIWAEAVTQKANFYLNYNTINTCLRLINCTLNFVRLHKKILTSFHA
jgi:hypothetical protein